MRNRISGKSSDTNDDPPSHTSWRNDDEERSQQSHSGSTVASSPNKKFSARADDQSSRPSRRSPSRGDERDRGFNPTSTSYSSTTQSPYPGTASASVATASGNHNDEPYIPPGLVRNASLADQMPKSRFSRDGRAKDEGRGPRSEWRSNKDDDEKERDRGDHRGEKKEKRDKKDKGCVKGSSRSTKSSRAGSGYGDSEGMETSRGPADFSDQVGASGFSQFPGQYDGSMPNTNGDSSEHRMSSHVQDQFPGQFPDQSTAPYRPPKAASEGGPGLAAEYYGDAGESVAEQPGNRANTPSLIIGAETHLQAALAVAAPPPEPSASGGVGAAASFFSGELDEHESVTSYGQQTSSTFITAPARPQGSHHSSSAPAIPTVGGAAIEAAAGFSMGSQASSHTQRPDHASSVGGAQQEHGSYPYQRPPSPTAEPYYSNASRPSRPGRQSSHSSNVPLYAAGAAGLAAAAYQHGHQTSSQHDSSRPQNPLTLTAQRHRHHGPFGAVVDFFKDPDGVAEFEEYSEIIGVCKYCFVSGSSPRDAPRKHHYRRKRSNESLGRVDKESRYYPSENERRRKKDKSWLATGLAGYGLAKVGESLFKQKNDFDDTYSVKTRRRSPDGRSQKSWRRSRSKDRIETGITSDGEVYKKDPQGGFPSGSKAGTSEPRRHSRSRSRSRDRKRSVTAATIGAAIGSSMVAPSLSPKDALLNNKHRNGEHSPGRRRKSHKKKNRGFFSMSSASSSSSSVDTVHRSDRPRSSKRSSIKSKDDRKAEAAILGLGAAAAALALNDGRNGHKKKGVKELVGVKDSRGNRSHDSRHDHPPEDEVWESAPEDEYESADSALAYGDPRRKGSRESLSSDSSGTNKWGWRWGSKKERRDSPAKRKSSDYTNLPTMAGAAGAGLAGAAMISLDQYQGNGNDSNSSLPLQQVFPIPTSDLTRYDVGREASVASSSRPAVVPIQHPQPITPVSAALYSSRPPYEHSYSAPTRPPVLSQKDYPAQPATDIDARFARPKFAMPGSFAQDIPHAKEPESGLKPRRRDSNPARFGDDAASSSIDSRRHASTKYDTSAVRFDRTEEQEENDRRERRRKRREDRQRREAEEQEQIDKERETTTEKSNKRSENLTRREESPQGSSKTSWAGPAVAAFTGAAIGAAALAEKSKSEETREERRERRRREREREEAEDEEDIRKRERRRKERERAHENDVDGSVGKEPQKVSDGISQIRKETDHQGWATKKEMSIGQEAKKHTSHECYGTFFRPLDLDDSNDQVKVTSANANANVDFDQTPAIVTVAPKGFRDPDAQPAFSPADTDDVVDTSRLSFPVPRLRLVEPTPPSSRGSTPIMRPRDTGGEGIEEPPRDHSPSKVTWGDEQTHEYTLIPPDEDDDHRQTIGSAPGEIVDTGLGKESEPSDGLALLSDTEQAKESRNVTESKNAPILFGDDVDFVATLAASAEDAGFDPSIVMNDPRYRRRDSPPGSHDRSMPGGFDDDEASSLSRRDMKEKGREAKLRVESEVPNSRDGNTVVQDIISQVERPESRISKKGSVDNLDDDWGSGKKSRSKKSKKARKEGSGSKDDFFESSGLVVKPESREISESPTEDTRSGTSIAPLSIDGGSSRKSRKKSKRDDIDVDDTASSVSAPSTVSASNEAKCKSKKSSLWDRVLGRSPDTNGTKDLPGEANMDEFEEPRKKSKKSKGRRSTRNEIDEDETAGKSSTTAEPDNDRPDSGGSKVQDPGRITQDLPTEVYPPATIDRSLREDILIGFKDREPSRSTVREAGSISEYPEEHNEPEGTDEQRSKSFLDMRPEPPPPPDRALREEEPPDPFATADLPVSPDFPPKDITRQYPQVPPSDPLPSPTAVPFDFRFSRPRPSVRSARSMSQTPPSSPHVVADLPPGTKLSTQSTEFKFSHGSRPPMHVEKYRSHQESAPEETYPFLPSSRTTSRSSSVHDPEEDEHDQRVDYEMTEYSHDPCEAGHGMAIIDSHSAVLSDLLDSQHATSTASCSQHSNTGYEGSFLPGSRGASPAFNANEPSSKTPSIAGNAAVGFVVGGTAAFALDNLTPDNDQSLPITPKEEEEDQFQHGLDRMAVDQGIDRSNGNKNVLATSLTAQEVIDPLDEEPPHKGQAHLQQSLGDVAPSAENTRTHHSSVIPKPELGLQEDLYLDNNERMLPGTAKDSFSQDQENVSLDIEAISTLQNDPLPEEDLDPREDFAPQNNIKSKKSKRKTSKPDLPEKQVTLPAMESKASSRDTVPDTLSPKKTQQIQEQDAQDAVDSWFAPASSSKRKKQTQRKGTVKRSSETSRPTTSIDSSEEKLESVEPIDCQQGENLTREMSSAAQDVANAAEDIRQPATTPNRDAMISLLDRRQSKSKAKKGKKGQRSTLQGDTSPPMSPGAKNVGFVKPSSEPFREGERHSPKPAAEFEDPEMRDERRIPSSIGLSPEAIPLPLNEDLDLLDEKPQEFNVLPTGLSDKSEIMAPPETDSKVLPIVDVLELPTTEAPRELSNQQDEDLADDLFALPPNRKGKKSKEAESGTLKDVITNVEVNDAAVPPEESSDAAPQKQNQHPAEEPPGGTPEDLRVVEDEWAKFDTKKKGKKARKLKQSFMDEPPMPPVPSDAAAQNTVQEHSAELVEEVSKEPIVAEDVLAGPSTKKKGKKSKQSKRVFTDDSGASADIRTETPMVLSTPQDAGKELTKDPDDKIEILDPQEESKTIKDELADFSARKKTNSSNKGKQSIRDDAVTGTEVEKGTLLSAAKLEVANDWQPENFADTIRANILQQEPNAIEGELTGFSSRKKGKKAKKSIQNFALDDERSADLRTDTGLAEATPAVVDELKGKIVIQRDDVSTFQEEPQAIEDERAGFSSKKGKKKTNKIIALGAQENTDTEAKSPVAVIASEVVEDIQARDSPFFQDTVKTSQQGPPTTEEEWAGPGSKTEQKKDEKQKSRTLGLDIEPLRPQFVETKGTDNIRSDPLAAPQATTSISRDIAAILRVEGNQASNDRAPEDPLLTSLKANRELHESASDHVLDHEEQDLPQAANAVSKASEPETQELEVIHQYIGDQNPPEEETVDPEVREPETQELAIIDQYGNEETNPPILGSSAATIDTARAIHNTLSHEGPVASRPFAKAENPDADQALENAEPDWDMPKKKKGKSSKQSEDLSLDEPKVNDFMQAPTPPAEVGVSLGQDFAVEEPDWNVPKKKKGEKSRKETLMLDEHEANDYLQASILPTDVEMPLAQEPVTEVFDEPASKKSRKDRKNKKKTLSRTLSEHEAATEGALYTPEDPRDIGIEGTIPTVQKEALPAVKSPGIDLQGQNILETPATIEPVQAFHTEEVVREGEPEMFQGLKPSRSKKDKKKAKKATTLNWEDEGDAAPDPKEKPLAEPESLQNDVQDQAILFDDKLVDEPTISGGDLPKTAVSPQPSSLDSKDFIVSSEPVASHEAYQSNEEAQTKDLKGNDLSRPDRPALADDVVEPPLHGYSNSESKEQSQEPAHEGAPSALPVSEQGPTASDDSEVRSGKFGANIDQPSEDAEYPYSLKRANRIKSHMKKARTPTLNDYETQQQPKPTLEAADAAEVQDQPSIIPISEHRGDWSRQEKLIDEMKPTEFVELGDLPPEIQEHGDNNREITPLATERPVDQPIEAGEDDLASIQKSRNGMKYTEERSSTFEPETDLSTKEVILGPIIAASSGRSEETTSEEHPRDGAIAPGERQSTLETGNFHTTADPDIGEPSSAPETQKILETKAEDGGWDVPIKKGKKGERSKEEFSDSGAEPDPLFAQGTQGPLTTTDPTQGEEEPMLEEQTAGNSKTSEGFDNVPSITGTDTGEPSTVPEVQETFDTKVDDEPRGILTKKGRMGKKSRREKPLGVGLETDRTPTEATQLSIDTAKSSRDNESLLEQHPQGELDAFKEMGDVDPIVGEEAEVPLPALQTQEITGTNVEDELWGMPIKKKKKGKSQRKDAIRIQEDFEITDAVSSGLPEVAQSSMDLSQDRRSVADAEALDNVVSEGELLNPQEQGRYDREYARELERQGVETPRSSKMELPTSAADSESLNSQRQLEHNHDHADKPERGDYEAPQRHTIDLPTPVQESEMQVSQEPLEHQQEHAKDYELQNFKAPRNPTLNLPNPAAESEQLNHGQEYPMDFEPEESESSQVPTKELPTAAAEVVMLDAQEQWEYDDEYARELERQLSPLQEGECSDLPSEEADVISTFQPSIDSMIGIPFKERTPLGRPPPLEDIVEESRSRSGSVQETTTNREDEIALLKATKKSRKGRKGKKQNQPIIWEDDTATPPVENEANQAVDVEAGSSAVPGSYEPGAPDQPINLEEPIEHRPVDENSTSSPTHIGLTKAPHEAEGYFAMRPSQPAEEDIGRDPENDGFRRSLSKNFPFSTDQSLSEQETHPSIGEIEHTQQGLHVDERRGPDSISESYQPERSTVPVNEEAEESLSYAPTKQSRKGKKSKSREVGRDLSPSMKDSDQVLNQSRRSGIPTVESSGQNFATQDYSPQRSLHREEEPLSGGDEPATGGHNTGDMEGLVATAGLGAAAALAAEGLARRDSKKGSKRGKKTTRWADLEDEIPKSGSPVSKGESVTKNAGQGLVSERQSGIRTWQQSAKQTQNPEQQSAVTSWQDFKGTPPQSPTALTTHEPITEAADDYDQHSLANHSKYRDSAINVSDSPVISEEVPVHRGMRDSGYPETESSPILASEPQFQDTRSEGDIDDSYDRRSQQNTQGYDQSYQTPERRRSTFPPTIAMEVDPDYDVSVSIPRERQRRSRSYDSDDSADSGFDIQRRRRRQAIAREAHEPSPVSSTTKEQSSALFNSSPSAREEEVDRPQEESASAHNNSLRQEPTWSFDHQGSLPPEYQNVSRERSSSLVSESIPDQSTYGKLTGRHEDPSASLFGGPIRQDEDITSESRSPPSSEVRGRRRRLNTISEDNQERLSLHAMDKRAHSDVGSPEAGIKERQMRSPPATDNARSYISTRAPNALQTGPTVDEEQRLDDFESSTGRNTEQSSSRPIDLSNLQNIPPKQREGEYRTASAASIQSDNSIHAIIRTPDQVRSASGQSYRSSGTPPLRRVDRSVSGDLRGANRLGEAKLYAKTSEAEVDSGVNIPSSSTYDPVTDKGKSRADMADVYVSLRPRLNENISPFLMLTQSCRRVGVMCAGNLQCPPRARQACANDRACSCSTSRLDSISLYRKTGYYKARSLRSKGPNKSRHAIIVNSDMPTKKRWRSTRCFWRRGTRSSMSCATLSRLGRTK